MRRFGGNGLVGLVVWRNNRRSARSGGPVHHRWAPGLRAVDHDVQYRSPRARGAQPPAKNLQLTRPYQLRLFGKGRKERYCPLWPQTAQVLLAFCEERQIDLRSDAKVFLNHRGTPLTRLGFDTFLPSTLTALAPKS